MSEYVKTNWQTGDIITAEKLNHIEDGIANNSKTYVTAILGTNKIAKDLTEDDLLNMIINLPDGIYPVCSVMCAYTHEQDSSVRIPDLFNITVAGPWTGITYKPSTGDLIVPGD